MYPGERLDASMVDESRYRLLVDSITDYAIYMLAPDGSISSWNAGARRFKGYEEAEVLGSNFSRFYTPEDQRAGMPQRALRIATTEGRFEGEGWRVRKDGSHFWCHVVIDPIVANDGRLLGFAKITRDLTERRQAENSLLQSEQQFRLLVQSVTDYAIYMLDPNGLITNWNMGAQRIKAYLPEEVIGKHFSLFFTEEDRLKGEPQRGIDTAARDGKFETQSWRVRKDGTRFWASVVLDPIRSEDGTLLGFAKITRDVTQAREAQLALEKAREALFQSQKIESLGQLTGGIAHDFNNLLMVILGSLQLVRKRVDDDPRVLSLLDNAIQGANRGVSLTQRMLAFARRQDLKLELIDVRTLVRGMAELLQRSLGPQITIETRFPLFLKSVLADSNKLEMALLNLAVNSRDAMPNGGVIVISSKERQITDDREGMKPGNYVCLSFTDSGEGMDEATLQRAKEPFFTTKGVGKGTGLGLSMVHGLAEQSGGRLFLKSEVGQGTTAELWLPAAVEMRAKPRPVTKPSSTQAGTNDLVVLAVDDDPLVLLSATAMLEDLGCTVVQASSAAEALVALEHTRFDLVLTDQVMPKMTGTQLAKAIQRSHPRLPVVLATGYSEEPTDIIDGLPRLNKPFDQEALAHAVYHAVNLAKAP
ncbi:hybrid sensor histidine kinase/response regulator [Pseudomonas borbori]